MTTDEDQDLRWTEIVPETETELPLDVHLLPPLPEVVPTEVALVAPIDEMIVTDLRTADALHFPVTLLSLQLFRLETHLADLHRILCPLVATIAHIQSLPFPPDLYLDLRPVPFPSEARLLR